MLMWENFGVSYWSRAMRVLGYLVFILIALVTCLLGVSYLNMKSDEALAELPNVLCPANVDEYAANLDYLEDTLP
jgi:hypothetical protein